MKRDLNRQVQYCLNKLNDTEIEPFENGQVFDSLQYAAVFHLSLF